MSRDELDRPDPAQHPGVGTDGSLTSHHHHGADDHVGVGTDGSLHSRHEHHDDETDDPAGHAGVGTDGSLHDDDVTPEG